MKKMYAVGCICLSLLIGCGGSDDTFVEEMTSRMSDDLQGFDEDVIESCIEKSSVGLSDDDKDVVLSMLNNPDGNQNFDDMEEAQKAITITTAFSQKAFGCVMKNK